jgi:RNA polymerase sigma-70 factor (ECF subfamily)
LDADAHRLRTGQASRPEIELRDLALDVMRTVAALPPDLQEVCIPLLAERVADVARSTGIPRGTIYERLAKVRFLFEDAGLRDYLE